MDKLIKLFSSRNARLVCLAIAILNRSLMAYHYSEFVNYDEKAQLASAFNLMSGNGLSLVKYTSENPDTPAYDRVQRWPPGYSLVVTPFLLLFNKNEFWATTCIDIIAGILFILLVQYLCRILSVSPAFTNITILLSGCFQYYIFIQSFPSDHLAFVSILGGIIVGIKLINKHTALPLPGNLLISTLFFLPFFFRYMYLPVSILLPVLIFLFSLFYKNPALRRNSLFVLIGTLLLVAGLLIWTKLYSGHYTYIVETKKGFFPNQLLHWYPFIPSAFVNIESSSSFVSTLIGKSYESVMQLTRILNMILFIALVFFIGYFFKKKNWKSFSNCIQFFVFAGVILSASILLVLGYLSLSNKPQVFWNYNLEGRYFIFPVVFIQLLFIVFISLHRITYGTIAKYLFIFLIALLLVESFHGIFSTAKIFVTGNHDNPFPTRRYLSYKPLMKILNEAKNKYRDREIIVTSPNEYFLYAADNIGFKPIYDFETINSRQPKVTKRSVLITVLNDDDAGYMSRYISEKKPVKFAYESFISFFAEEIDPLPAP